MHALLAAARRMPGTGLAALRAGTAAAAGERPLPHRPHPAGRAWPGLVLFALYALAGLRGYGVDQDTYLILRAGRDLLLNGFYVPSRYQGTLVGELVIGAASVAGGHVLSNAVSALLGTLTLVMMHGLLRERMKAWQAAAAVAIIAVNPWYAIAASSSMDYVYGLFLLVLGTRLIRRGTPRSAVAAGLAFALAVSARFSVAPMVAAVYLLWWVYAGSPRVRVRVAASGAVGAVATALLHVPAWLAARRTLGFLGYTIGDWTVAEYLARFAYKSVFLWGLLPALVLAAGAVWALRRRPRAGVERRWLVSGLVLAGVAELLFLMVPLEVSYLLPGLLAAVPLWVAWVGSRAWTAALFVLTLAYNVVSVDVLRLDHGSLHPRAAQEPVGARPALHLKGGVLLQDLRDRPMRQRTVHVPPGHPARARGSDPAACGAARAQPPIANCPPAVP